jgi:hypothetical protein
MLGNCRWPLTKNEVHIRPSDMIGRLHVQLLHQIAGNLLAFAGRLVRFHHDLQLQKRPQSLHLVEVNSRLAY